MMAPKKLLAAALASLPLLAFGQTPATPPAAEPAKPAAPAAAPAPAVQIYGTLNVNTQYTQAAGATAGTAANITGRGAVSVDSSNIGVRGTLELGSTGLKGTYQCETGANIDGIGVSGICNRNSRVGIVFGLGTLWYGNWDTPFKAAAYGTKADDPFGNTDVYGFQGLLGSPGFNYRSGAFVSARPGTGATAAAGSTVGGFDLRAQNSVGFHSAKFGGLSFKLQYSANEFSAPNGKIEPMLFGGVVNFDRGPLSAFAAYERHDDAFGLNTMGAGNFTTSSLDDAFRVGAGYELPIGLTVSGMYEQLYFRQHASAVVTELHREAWHLAAKERIGNHEFRARFGQAYNPRVRPAGGDMVTAEDLQAEMWALGYAYYFAPTFQMYLSYAQIFNGKDAQYTFSIGGAPAVAGATPAGADPMALGLGFRYAF